MSVLYNLYTSPNISEVIKSKEDEMGEACSKDGTDKNYIHNFGLKTLREKTTRKT
jgi:hypothetical protein